MVSASLLVLILAMLVIGEGLDRSGAAQMIVDAISPTLSQMSPLGVVFVLYFLTQILTELLSNNAVAVIVTPVDPALFRPVPVADDGAVRVLMLFHEYPWKGVAEGIEAFQRVRARHPSAVLVGFGVKPPKRPLPFTEFHENLPQERLSWLYSRCAIYLCPSWDEGLGMPSMEAMACGAALCTYDNGGCRDYAIDGRTGVVAPRRDLDALARGLGRLLEDTGLRRRVAREGQEFVRTRFDWERATARLEAILAAR